MLKLRDKIDQGDTITQWVREVLSLPEVHLQVRLRGNHLHILCEGKECPSVELAVTQLSSALRETPLSTHLPPSHAKIYQVFLSGRREGERRNNWTVRLDCKTTIEHTVFPETTSESLSLSLSDREIREEGELTPPSLPPVRQKLEDVDTLSPQLSHPSPLLLEEDLIVEYPLKQEEPIEDMEFSQELPILPVMEGEPPQSPIPEVKTEVKVVKTIEPLESPDASFLPLLEHLQIEGGSLVLAKDGEESARRGDPEAIASYLSEILGALGVTVKVLRRPKPSSLLSKTPEFRLWVLCESEYSPDPSLLAQPIAQRLRNLELKDFRDGIIVSQVKGERKPDWMLRIDLTPPERMLKELARWGDPQAIERLLKTLLPSPIHTRVCLKESTLHLFSSLWGGGGIPDQEQIRRIVRPFLESLSPQGVQAATLYGVESSQGQESPAWIDWIPLPGTHHPDLRPTPRELGQEGDTDALLFLLGRLVNPDLDQKLKTGGIRLLLLRKGHLLHIMSEAIVCPSQTKIAPPLAKFLRELEVTGLRGVRIYGRRAGQKIPLWRYGVDFTPIRVPSIEPAPEFAPSLTDLTFAGKSGDLVWHPDLTPEVIAWENSAADSVAIPQERLRTSKPTPLRDQWLQLLQRFFITSGVFIPQANLSWRENERIYQRAGLAIVWAALGCVVTWQIDTQLSQWVSLSKTLPPATPITVPSTPVLTKPSPSVVEATLPESPLPGYHQSGSEIVFNPNRFTKKGENSVTLAGDCKPSQKLIQVERCQPIPVISFPSFRSQQLDDQLVRYQQYLQQEKRPPDILIVGSSRALRGIEPEVLTQTLAQQGYPLMRVYNFGINGATAQVVDLLIRRILPPEQLPKFIIFADGSRALNSGRVDVTFNAISVSEGYRKLLENEAKLASKDSPSISQVSTSLIWLNQIDQFFQSIRQNQTVIQSNLSEKMANLSPAYSQREQVQFFVKNQLFPVTPVPLNHLNNSEIDEGLSSEDSGFESNGFLPISIKFDPFNYYQKHPKVSGDYDGDYQDFKLVGVQTKALLNLTNFTKKRQIQLIFLNMPLTQDYLDKSRMRYEKQFRQKMLELSNETGLLFHDMLELWPENHAYFSDPSHLNRYGAVAVSQFLGQEKSIPWPIQSHSQR